MVQPGPLAPGNPPIPEVCLHRNSISERFQHGVVHGTEPVRRDHEAVRGSVGVRLLGAGVIAHHQAVMAHADWIIDLGPGAGHDGGQVIFEGTPADLVADRSTLTGEHLAAYAGV